MENIESLITRLEKASGPSAEMDSEIYWLFSDWKNVGGGWREHRKTGKREIYSFSVYPSYTASIDAALTLVPEYDRWMLMHAGFAYVAECGDSVWQSESPFPAIALCTAALRARLAILSKEEA